MMSSAAALHHPGLVFATLVIQLVAANGSPAPVIVPRRDCTNCDDDGDEGLLITNRQIAPRKGGGCDDDDGATCSTSSTAPPPPAATTEASATTTQNNNSTSTSGPSPTSGSTSMNLTMALPPVSTPSPTPTPTPQLATVSNNMSITTGGIIGTAFGAFVIVVASLILCGTFYRRWRRAQNHPQALSSSSAFHIGPPPPFEANPREMSQTQSSPLVASAVASRMTSTPPHHYHHSSPSTSLSPLVPAGASLDHSPSFTSSSNRRTSLSYTDGSSNHEPLQANSTHEMSMSTSSWSLSQRSMALRSGFTSGLAGIILGSTTPPDPTPEPSNLVRSMTAYQKSLEADDRKSSQSGPSSTSDSSKQEEQDITENNDPPPRYDA